MDGDGWMGMDEGCHLSLYLASAQPSVHSVDHNTHDETMEALNALNCAQIPDPYHTIQPFTMITQSQIESLKLLAPPGATSDQLPLPTAEQLLVAAAEDGDALGAHCVIAL